MNNEFKLIESSHFIVGEDHSKWDLYMACYQHAREYSFVLFDGNDRSEYIQSAIVTPATSNTLEQEIINATYNPHGLESIADVFERLQSGFYGSLFVMQTVK